MQGVVLYIVVDMSMMLTEKLHQVGHMSHFLTVSQLLVNMYLRWNSMQFNQSVFFLLDLINTIDLGQHVAH